MSNQTVDGVPRELLDLAAKQLVSCGRELVAQELRALLDAPEPLWNPHPAVANLAALLIKLAQHGVKVSGGKGDEPWTVEPSAQPQVVPVTWATIEAAIWGAFADGSKDYKGCTRERLRELQALYAEQPAPVATIALIVGAIHDIPGFPGITGIQIRQLAERLNAKSR